MLECGEVITQYLILHVLWENTFLDADTDRIVIYYL